MSKLTIARKKRGETKGRQCETGKAKDKGEGYERKIRETKDRKEGERGGVLASMGYARHV